MNEPAEPRIVLYDGVCRFCDWNVRNILSHDPHGRFHFCALQSAKGRGLLRAHGFPEDHLGSLVLIEDGKAFTESGAVLRIWKRLSGFWPWLYVFILLPPFFRDALYRWVARNRYRWFGKREHCAVPQQEWKGRFLED